MFITRKFCWLWFCAFAGSLILASADPSSAFNLFKKKKKKKPQTEQTTEKGTDATSGKTKPAPKIPLNTSHRFFAFEDAPYFTSPDKRIGAKLVVDSVKVGPTMAALQHITFLPGAALPSHRHVYVTEVVFVVKGNLTLRIDKETKVMGPDACAYIPPQTFHEYANTSQDVCQFLQFYSPSGPEEEYRNWETPDDVQAKTEPGKVVATGPVHIITPPMAPLPGTPETKLGTVKEETGEPATASGSAATLQTKGKTGPATPVIITVPAASLTLQLKRSEKGSIASPKAK